MAVYNYRGLIIPGNLFVALKPTECRRANGVVHPHVARMHYTAVGVCTRGLWKQT